MAKKKPKKHLPLNDRQLIFIREYVKTYNASRAAIKAGYSQRSAGVIGHDLLKNPKISVEIKKRRDQLEKQYQTSIDEMIMRSLRVARFDPREMFDDSGALKPIHELDDDTAGAISGIESKDLFAGSGDSAMKIGELKTIKVSDRNHAIEAVMKHLGGYERDNKQKSQGLIDAAKVHAKAAEKAVRVTEKSSLFKSMLAELNAADK